MLDVAHGDVEECHEAFLPFKRVCKSDGKYAFGHGRYGVFAAEFEDSFNERLEYSSPLSQVFVIGEEIACKPPVPEQSFLMEEVGIKPDKLECGTGNPFAACINGLAPGMNPASHMREITILPRIGITAQPVRLEGSAIVSYNIDKGIVPSVFSVGKDYRSLGSVRIGCRPDRHVGIVSGPGCL